MFVSFSIRYNQRPPSLLAPGVLHFRTEQSHKYYFHPKVSIPSIYAPSIRKILLLVVLYTLTFFKTILGGTHHKIVSFYEKISSWSEDKFCMCGDWKTKT